MTKCLQTIAEEILLDPNRRITTEDMMDNILDVLPTMRRRMYFNDKTQTVVEQVYIDKDNGTWINVKKKEFIENNEEYFKRKLIGK